MSETPGTMNGIGWATKQMLNGERVRRRGWNAKNMWIAYSPGNPALPAAQFWSVAGRNFAMDNGGTAEVLPTIILKTADDKILIGWHCSVTDQLAMDWEIAA